MERKFSSKKAISWLCFSHLIVDVYSGFLNPIMPFVAAKVGFSLATATAVISISHICSSLLQPIFGFFADNILKRFFIFWGLILASIFIPVIPLAPNISYLVSFMILGSLGVSFYHPQALGFINYFSQSDCSKNMGAFISLGSLGFAFGPLIAAFVTQIAGLENLPYTSFIGIFIAFLMFNFVPKLSKIETKPQHKEFLKSFKEIMTCRQINFLMLISMMKSLVTNSSCILLPFLWKSLGYSPFYIGFALFLFVFFGSIASFLSPKLEKIFGAKKLIYFSMSATFPQMILFAYFYKTHSVLSLIIFSLIGFTTMLAQPVTLVWAQKTLPQYKSIIAGFINGFCWGVIALCMSVLGIIAQNFGIVNLLITLSLIPLFSTYFLKYLKNDNKH